jgi:hypothetical protein
MRVVIAAPSEYQYLLCDNRWWEGQDETQDGWLGIYTRWGGWRWIPVRPFKTVDTTQRLDPQAFRNNAAMWDITWVCQRPYYTQPTTFGVWSAQGTTKNKAGYFTGTITLANQGDMQTYVQYLINGVGLCQVQDNNSSTMVTLPKLFATDGPGLVDSDPMERTLTAANDAFDTSFYDKQRSSNLLNFFLTHNKANSNEQWWQRGYVRFVHTVPPQTIVQFNVAAQDPNASITVMLTQRFKRSR